MSSVLDELRKRMEVAAASMDFEEASWLRDQISLLRCQPDDTVGVEIDTSGLTRQRPGAMGLGPAIKR